MAVTSSIISAVIIGGATTYGAVKVSEAQSESNDLARKQMEQEKQAADKLYKDMAEQRKKEDEEAAAAASKASRAASAKAQAASSGSSRGGTILTSPLGITEPPKAGGRKTILGA